VPAPGATRWSALRRVARRVHTSPARPQAAPDAPFAGTLTTVPTDTAWLDQHVRIIEDYPQAGVTFRDITPLLAHAKAFTSTIDALADHFAGAQVDTVIGVEARGFIVAAPVAYRLGAGFVPVRKAGKLPWAVAREEYLLEYGTDKLEIHRDAIRPGERVAIIDDVLATGGTAAATLRLVEALGAHVVGLGFIIELPARGGRARVASRDVMSLLRY